MSENITASNESAPAILQAFREPDQFMLRWHQESKPYGIVEIVVLALVALTGTLAYGALVGSMESGQRAFESALLYSAAAAVSWAAGLPAIYILNSLAGARLRLSTTLLAALLTASWGGMGLIAFLPIAVLIIWTFPQPALALAVHLLIVALVGVCMAIFHGRLIAAVERGRGGARSWWLWLFTFFMVELLYAFGVINFSVWFSSTG